MTRQKKEYNELTKATRTAGLYNMVPNLIWSALSLVPLTVFCYTHINAVLFGGFLMASMLPAFLPNAVIGKMQLLHNVKTYKHLGVNVVYQLSQHGSIVNRLIRKRYPNYKAVSSSRQSIKKLYHQTFMFEKFHLCLFVFFFCTIFYALISSLKTWAAILFLINIFYNVYPIMLQQYVRTRLHLFNSSTELHVQEKPGRTFWLKCQHYHFRNKLA